MIPQDDCKIKNNLINILFFAIPAISYHYLFLFASMTLNIYSHSKDVVSPIYNLYIGKVLVREDPCPGPSAL